MNRCERGFRVWEWEGTLGRSNSSQAAQKLGGKRKLLCRFMAERRLKKGTRLNTPKMGQAWEFLNRMRLLQHIYFYVFLVVKSSL